MHTMTESRMIRLDPTPPPYVPACTFLEVGTETTGPEHIFPARRVAGAAIIGTVAGQASAEINGRHIQYRPGVLVAVGPGFSLVEHADSIKDWTVRWCVFEGPWAETLGQQLSDQVLIVAKAPQRWFQDIADLFDLLSTPGRSWQALSRFTGLLEGVSHQAQTHDCLDAPITKRVCALLDHTPDYPWTLAEIAKKLDISASTLSHRFSAESGEGVSVFLRKRRCAYAAMLLARGLSVHDVASRLGFTDQFQFSRCYRKVMGEPPSVTRFRGGLRGNCDTKPKLPNFFDH